MREKKGKRREASETRIPTAQDQNLMPEAFMPGHEVVCWREGQPTRGYIDGVEVIYGDDPDTL